MAEDEQTGTFLILGASGFLGAQLVWRAREALGARPRLLAASRSGGLVGPGAESAERVRLDLRERGELLALLEATRPALVLNAAALARAHECERAPEEAALLNTALPGELADWCGARGARLVHVSSDQVYGQRPAPPGGFSEADPPAPLGVYGASKAAGERAVLERDPRALVVRLPLLYGASFGRGLGASDALLAALERGERPGLFVDEWRTPLAVEDAARALVELALGEQRGLLHVAGPERTSRWELGLAVLASRGLSLRAARGKLRAIERAQHPGPARAADTSLDTAKAQAWLRRPLLGIEAGLLGIEAGLRGTEAGRLGIKPKPPAAPPE